MTSLTPSRAPELTGAPPPHSRLQIQLLANPRFSGRYIRAKKHPKIDSFLASLSPA